MAAHSLAEFTDIKAIFFDTAETLYTSPEMEAAYPEAVAKLVAKTRHISLEAAEALLKQTKNQLQQTTTEHITKVRTMAELGFSRAQVHEAFCTVNPRDFLQPDPALNAVMAELKQHYRLGIISNFKAAHIAEILAALDLSVDWFPILVTEDVVTEIKPNPEPFLKATELASCQPQECLYIGDSLTKDIKPAKKVGMQTILVSRVVDEKQEPVADAIILDVKQVIKLLKTE